jgi:MFS transporter, FSR family, fosmidomycin resistance protein
MTDVPAAGRPFSPWRRMRLWAAAHAIDDVYQGLVPACVPYFVLDRHYGYVAASGLTLAATLGAALPQLVVGFVVDRYRLSWMAGAGVSLAGVGVGMSGVAPGYALVWTLLFVSGLGVAMFHPAAGKAARRAAGDSTSAMSIFATGGNVGFFLAPVLATPALTAAGLDATVLFIPPAVLTGFVLLRHQRRIAPAQRAAATAGTDQWSPFLLLTAVEITRSVNFFVTSTFIELYWIAHLHASRQVAGVALTCFLTGGIAGTLLGGRLADRFGLTRTVLAGNAAAIPAMIALRVCPGAGGALVAALAAGVAVRIPFSVLVKLGQDYLPGRPGTASGVTLGLAVSAGGLAAPLFGAVAAAHGTPAVFTLLCLLPVPAVALSSLLPEPSIPPERPRRHGDRGHGPDRQRDGVADRERQAGLKHAAQAGGQCAGGQ